MLRKLIMFAGFLMLTGTTAITTPNEYVGFRFNNEQKEKVTIRFRLVHNLILIPLQINESDTLNFILDSGVRNTILMNVPPGDSIRLSQSRELKIHGLGAGLELKAVHSWNNNIYLPGITGQKQDVLIVTGSPVLLSENFGEEIHGLIGYDFLKHFVVEINYIRKKLTIYKKPPSKIKRFNALPFSMQNGKPYVTVHSEDTKGVRNDLHMLIDLGASYACSLLHFAYDSIRIPGKSIYSYLGQGLSGDINGHIGRIAHLEIGGYNLKKPVITYPDSNAVNIPLSRINYHGSIGSGILSRFHIILDYGNSRIYFRKNRHFRSKFKYDLFGGEVITPYPGLPVYTINRVRRDSPAEKAGLKKGDQIIRINQEKTVHLTLSEVIGLLNWRNNKKIKVEINRNGETEVVKVKLKDII